MNVADVSRRGRGQMGEVTGAARSVAGAAPRSSLTREQLASVQRSVLETGRELGYAGYSKHDALNAPWLEAITRGSRWARLLAIQLVMRSPFHVRPTLGVRRARNAKGLALFARAWLSRYRTSGDEEDAREARLLLDWLADHSASGFDRPCWGYPYPWQDVGFYAPRDFPNRVVTSFVVQALLDGYRALDEPTYLSVAEAAVEFLLRAPATLYEDDRHRCVSYVPSADADWIVLDVSALVGAVTARLAAIRDSEPLMREAGRLIRYVASRQTDYGAWYYAEPPSASHISHDNYHTGFILDALLEYGEASGSDEFRESYRRGLEFYRERLFERDGAPRFMHDRAYPRDIHGCAQGILTFSKAERVTGRGEDMARAILGWTLANMYEPDTGWFSYQRRRLMRTRIRLLRWCQAWMAWAIGHHLESFEEAT